ncbi:MAG: hypothetical protein KC912_20790 [Proteobacteria bacterium]|nr:hypothetical protein [Pseudomonadota bacterium]
MWLLALLACSGTPEPVTPPAPPEASAPVHAEEPAEPKLGLQADGTRWPLDESTRDKMGEITSLAADTSPETVEQFQTLGNQLDDVMVSLVQGCAMEGEPHDQLHHFLVIFLPELEALQKAESAEAGTATLTKIRTQTALFAETFE